MARIDWAFIGTLEGEAIPKGYVPSDNSGVTIATGVDLGQRAMLELLALGLAAALTDKLKPYLGLKGNAARDKLNSAPLTLSAAEVAQLDQALRARFLPALVLREGGTVRSVRVNHRPRRGGVSKYGIFDRLGVSIVDLFGVMWLQRRAPRSHLLEEVCSDSKTGSTSSTVSVGR